jgi:RNA polymerase sigma factor (sigma-70 family)
MTPHSDSKLWQLAVAGDADAFGEVYTRHDVAVHTYCLWRTGDPSFAEDATSIVFLEAWRRRAHTPLTTGTARPLLLGIATNVVRHQWRSQRRHRAALERLRFAGEPPGAHEDEALDRIAAASYVRTLSNGLRILPPRELEVLMLLAWGELTYEQTAAALRLPIGTVRSRMSRARARLRASPELEALASPRTAGFARPAPDIRVTGVHS